MIKSVTITNHLDESIMIDLFDPDSSGFIIKSIDGLGPVKANVNFKEIATNDGAIDNNSARLSSRNIVMSLEFLGSPTIEETRLKSYKYFPIKRNIKFLIETDNRICETIGRVETNVPTIFSKAEGCQISILCSDPYFYSAGEDGINKTVFYGTEPLFEFPFSNESLTENLIEFGSIERKTEATIYYDGDAEIGITIRIHAIGEVEGFIIYNVKTRETMQINDEKLETLMGSGIQAGDEIIINTSRGKKSIYMLRSGVLTNIMNALEKPINWFQLSKGDNTFVYMADNGLSNIQFEIENKVIYEGV